MNIPYGKELLAILGLSFLYNKNSHDALAGENKDIYILTNNNLNRNQRIFTKGELTHLPIEDKISILTAAMPSIQLTCRTKETPKGFFNAVTNNIKYILCIGGIGFFTCIGYYFYTFYKEIKSRNEQPLNNENPPQDNNNIPQALQNHLGQTMAGDNNDAQSSSQENLLPNCPTIEPNNTPSGFLQNILSILKVRAV